MSSGTSPSYRQGVTALRSRILLTLCAAIAAIGLVAVALPDRSEPRADVGTEGDRRAPGTTATSEAPLEAGTTPTSTDDGAVVAGDAPTSTTAGPAPGTSTTAPNPPTSTTVRRATGPHDLLGRVAFVTNDGRFWSMRPDGSDRRAELSCPGGDPVSLLQGSPVEVSPDGTRVVRLCPVAAPFTTDGGPFGRWTSVSQPVDGGEPRVLAGHPATSVHAPAWSPDGRHVAVPQWDNTVLVLDADTGGTRVLTVPVTDEEQHGLSRISWSPDGSRFVDEKLELVDAGTGAVEELRYAAYREDPTLATWSPDGRWIYFTEREPYNAGSAAAPRLALLRIDVTTRSVERVLEDLDPTGNDYTEPPVFLDATRALVVRNSGLWLLTLDADDGGTFWNPVGHLTQLVDDFDGHHLSTPRWSGGLAHTG